MSNFSDLYTKIRATIPTLTGFTTKTEIPNPYSLIDNPEPFLANGWGVKVGSSDPIDETYKQFDSYLAIQSFEILVTRQVFKTDSDAAPAFDAAKLIRDDINTIQSDFTSGTRFTMGADKVDRVDIVTITSIESVIAEKANHITASITFNFSHWR